MARSSVDATWKKGLLVPKRFELAATPGPERRRRLSGPVPAAPATGPPRHADLGLRHDPRHRVRFRRARRRQHAELCELVGVAPDGGALVRSRRSGRTTLGLTERGRLCLVVKAAADHDRVARESRGAATGPRHHPRRHRARRALGGPVARASSPWPRRPSTSAGHRTRHRPRRGAGHRRGAGTRLRRHGPVVHGDFAPWNLLRTADGIALVDWESSRFELDPMYDLAHFVASKGALLGAHAACRRRSAAHRRRHRRDGATSRRSTLTLARLPTHVRRYLEQTMATGQRDDPSLSPRHARAASERSSELRGVKILQLHNRYREAGGEDSVVRDEARLLPRRGPRGHRAPRVQSDRRPRDRPARWSCSPSNPLQRPCGEARSSQHIAPTSRISTTPGTRSRRRSCTP